MISKYIFDIIMETHKYYVLLGLIIFFIVLLLIYSYGTKREKIISVKKKFPLEGENKYGRKTIITDNNEVYNTTNSIFYNHYNFDLIYDSIEQNKKYKIICYGFRIERFDTLPNIIKVDEIF